jgi:hypothetical protein
MTWLLISLLFLGASWGLPVFDEYGERLSVKVLTAVCRGLGLITFGIWLGVLCG